eukprot:4701085-Pleurochrysis_carterae.AAC.2
MMCRLRDVWISDNVYCLTSRALPLRAASGRGDYGRTQSEYGMFYESHILETGQLLSYDRLHRQGGGTPGTRSGTASLSGRVGKGAGAGSADLGTHPRRALRLSIRVSSWQSQEPPPLRCPRGLPAGWTKCYPLHSDAGRPARSSRPPVLSQLLPHL